MTRTLLQEEPNDRRACERFQYQAPCIYAIGDADAFHHAEMLNYSLEGLCLMTESPLKPGDEICLRMVNNCSDSAIHYHARVRWCHGISPKKTSFYVGLRYSRKHIKQVFGFNKTKSRKLFCRNTDQAVPACSNHLLTKLRL